MHSNICDFPSKTLYSSKLVPDPSVASHLLADLPGAENGNDDDNDDDLKQPVVFFDTSGCEYFERLDGDNEEGSRCNENEGTIVKNWVDELVCTLCSLQRFELHTNTTALLGFAQSTALANRGDHPVRRSMFSSPSILI